MTDAENGLSRSNFLHRNPSLFQWKYHYVELSPAFIEAVTKEQWLTKLTSDGGFLSEFLLSLVEQVSTLCDVDDDDDDDEHKSGGGGGGGGGGGSNATARQQSGVILWDTIPAYWLCIKLYICLLRQAYADKLASFSKTTKFERELRGGGGGSYSPRGASSSLPTFERIFRFKIEGPRAFNSITKAAKELVRSNHHLLNVWIPLCLHNTNMNQFKSVEMSMRHLDDWMNAALPMYAGSNGRRRRGVGPNLSMPLLIGSLEMLLTSKHHRILSATLSFIYGNVRRLFPLSQEDIRRDWLFRGTSSSSFDGFDGATAATATTATTATTAATPKEDNFYLKLMGTILLSKHFFPLFLHWDHNVRAHFHHILVYRLFLHSKRTDIHLISDDIMVTTATNVAKIKREEKIQEEKDVLLYEERAAAKAAEERAARFAKEEAEQKFRDEKEKEKEKEKEEEEEEYECLSERRHPTLLASSESFTSSKVLRASTLMAFQDLQTTTSISDELLNDDDEDSMEKLMHRAREKAATLGEKSLANRDDTGPRAKGAWGKEIEIPQKKKKVAGSDDDDAIVELYTAMMKRVILVYNEYETSDRTKLDRENILGDLDQEAELLRGGVVKGTRSYVKRSIEEFAIELKRYYTYAERSDTADIPGPRCIVVGVR